MRDEIRHDFDLWFVVECDTAFDSMNDYLAAKELAFSAWRAALQHSNPVPDNCPVAYLDEDGRVVRISEDGSGDGGFVSKGRAIPDYWKPLFTRPHPVAPNGWKLVPVEPTIEMIAALGWNGDIDLAIGHAKISGEIEKIYAAMLAARPDTQP